MKKAIIFGAGKIAKGFIGQLLYLSNFEITFVDVSESMVKLLNKRKKYHVHVLGAPELDSEVTHFIAYLFENDKEIFDAFLQADVAFVSVGGTHLPQVGKSIAQIFNKYGIPNKEITIVACENWKDAGHTLQNAIKSNLKEDYRKLFTQNIGVSEAVMMRTATQLDTEEAKEHPEDVWVQNFWYLPIDGRRVKGTFPKIKDVELLDNFGNFLIQKMYTNNTSNAVIAYTGYLLGYQLVAEAANSPEISEILDQTYKEINQTLEAELGVDPCQQEEFSKKARAKYTDWTIIDQVTRHAKDPIRKLGPEDRLIGPARMALKHDIYPKTIIDTIAKALFFDYSKDESAMKLKKMREEKGIPFVLKEICQLDEDETLYGEVLRSVDWIREQGLVRGHE